MGNLWETLIPQSLVQGSRIQVPLTRATVSTHLDTQLILLSQS